MKKYTLLFLFLSLMSASCKKETKEATINTDVPEWAQTAIWYQIFVERFNNGDPNNDPTLESIKGSWPDDKPANWKISNWTGDWYENEYPQYPFYTSVQMRRYGGDLQGVIDKLDYIQDLGVNALYINPLNDAPSMHKYDARNYHHVDINFGPDPKGDLEIIASENPNDPSTWKWTSADKLFLKLIEESKKRGIRIVLDYSWNHTGTEFWAWKDLVKNQEKSPYADWYMVDSFDDPSTPENEFKYTGWAGVPSLPELKKVDVVNRPSHGKPYEGNMQPDVKKHIFDVTRRWLAPNGDVSKGIDGYRLDVADQVPMGFWRDYRKEVRSINPEALLVGEIWWQTWPDTLMDTRPYVVGGDIFDIVMHYQQYKPARAFFAKTSEYRGAAALQFSLDSVFQGLSEKTAHSMMHMSASHDAPRLLTSFYNKGKYKYKVKPSDDSLYKAGKPDEETYKRVKLYLAHQYTFVGAPQIWAGDEMGMWGADDPDCRKPLWWQGMTFTDESSNPLASKKEKFKVGFDDELHAFYKQLIAIRKNNPVLSTGKLEYLKAEGDILVYRRSDSQSIIDIYFNNSNDTQQIKAYKPGKSMLTNREVTGEVNLQPLSFEIVKTN